jgi:aspartyl-tRNA(Asn)/glutamyl-tRNA(Gln) amidotransferase subunit C
MTHEEIQKLGFLARIEVSEEDATRFAGDMDNILNFLKQIESVDVSDVTPVHRFKNVVREDEKPYEKGQFSQDLLAEAPEVQDGFIKVKKIL